MSNTQFYSTRKCNFRYTHRKRAKNRRVTVVGEVIVDHQRNLLDVNATSPHVCCDQHPALATPELLHNGISLLLRHVTVHRAHREVGLPHLLCQPVDLPLCVAEDHCLGDSESVIEVAQSVKLPLLPLNSHEELLDPLQCQLVTLHQDADWVRHELAGHL